ncbi:MAG: hypothetical protein ACD_3C00042G0004 [uncultured bacterium (gcode 4)]|uniref:Nucleoside phosphorylase domain-containing protein n=1 Tax=uncultured bacterium (gcode 4) TaxID=1234023 RepID=K2GED7_9BACT|nr:MAG: hypothetical protein ACD_3C00042G0004 [uncultured bacterium (gcode 4)]
MNTDSIIDQIKKIEQDWNCAVISLQNPDSRHSKNICWEIVWIESLESYMREEFENLTTKNISIEISRWREFTRDTDMLFLKNLEDNQSIWNAQKRLFLFSPERVVYSLERLKHYTSTDPKDFQRYMVLTNYDMHIELLKEIYSTKEGFIIKGSSWACQMNTIHISDTKSWFWFSVINIGIGPSNAKTITDHLAVMRPKLFLMIWHCGGLRNHQEIWEFVLADKFVSDCGILNKIQRTVYPLPIIPTFNLNIWLKDILEKNNINYRLWTVFTTEDRNWELNYSEYKEYFNEDRSVAIDMESAIISAQWFKYKVPNATLLMISDKPFHWKLKKSKESQEFYTDGKKIHLKVLSEFLEEIFVNEEYCLLHNHLWSLLWAKDDTIFK